MSTGYTIYLIHIEPRYKHAGHYLGICRNGRDVAERFKEHHEGRGAVLTQYARRAGCNLHLARVWFNCEFASERRMKGRSLVPLCPICKERALLAQRDRSKLSAAHTSIQRNKRNTAPVADGSRLPKPIRASLVRFGEVAAT